ncbi:SDR family oxidoreductase [Mycobacterium sp. 1274756.6]|uniref:SDR family oxidoreductase n=1 Tax=Mycobacterium sp. 1274756.6 TaxID=1834076 RepID=UPI0007FF0F71|nr:SDR family oxidoreductase [Mycobacterium sp. 1274756.6]OBJ67699.1 short chain dehydrogenase [Mycobacterium sp. 1274756.6]
MTDPTPITVTASDGIALAVHRYTDVDPGRPTILAVHGYPDNHHVWDGVAEELLRSYPDRYNVVAFDVRGAGESAVPGDRSAYRLPQLVADIGAVIAELGVDEVHLLGHDWGSIQGWAAVTDPELVAKIGSYTSISGPHLDYAGKFLRSARTPGGVADVAKQAVSSGYIWLFLTPRLPEAIFRSGLGQRVITGLERIGRSSTRSQDRDPARTDKDFLNGLNLYRANMPGALFAPTRELPEARVPVQVLVPRKDLFVSPALQRFTGSIPPGGRVVPIEGGHWVITSRPDVIARLTAEWVDRAVAAATVPAGVPHGLRGEVAGKTALITGAGAGIGRATAIEFARQGARTVVIVDRDRDAAADTAAAVRAAGADAAVYQVDVTDDTAINALAAQVKSEHGVIDILVNNAGIGMAGRFLETSAQNWDDILAVNLRGVLNGSRAFAEQMVERGEGGTIINVASAAAFLPSKSMVAYGTTKAAVLAFSESLRADLADDGITVTAVCPGFVNTNIAKNTVYAGMSADAQDRAREKADAAYRRRNYTPEATAKAIVKAVRTGPPVLPIAPESRLGYAMRRISPTAVRLLARLDLRQT